MAESTVAVTPGSGKNLRTYNRTISATSVEEEFFLLGENPMASYTVSAAQVAGTTANSHMMQIMAGSTLNVRIRRIVVTQFGAPAAVSAYGMQIWRLTTAGTGGTSITPSKLDNAAAAAGATAMTLPTSKGTEGVQLWQEALWLGTTAIPTFRNRLEWVQHPNSQPIIIPAGTSNGIAIKNVPGLASTSLDISVEFTETSFV